MDNFYEIAANIPKLSFREYDEFLDKSDEESKNAFILAFMPYIINITQGIFNCYKTSFNAYYSYEDFVSDGVMVATSMYFGSYFKSINPKRGFKIQRFMKIFHILMLDRLRYAYSFKVTKAVGYRINRSYKQAMEFKDANGRFPTLEELVSLTGYKKPTFYRMATMEYLDKSMSYDEEDDILESLSQKDLVNDLNMELANLKPCLCEVVCRLNGYPDGSKISEVDLGKELGVSQQLIHYRRNKAYKKIKARAPYLRDYYTK